MRTILLIVMLAACRPPRAGDTLGESVRDYNEGVRWERYAVAAIHVPANQRSQFVDEADERGKELRITDYELVRVEQKGDREAQVQVKVSWYRESEGKLQETQVVQTWERQGKTWLIVDEARLRGPEMPGLPEPMGRKEASVREPPMKD